MSRFALPHQLVGLLVNDHVEMCGQAQQSKGFLVNVSVNRPEISGSGAEVEAIFDVAVLECQRDEVTSPVLRVAVVEDESVGTGRFDDDLELGERQNGPL